MNNLKMVIVGDDDVGKISFAHYLVNREIPKESKPIVIENFVHNIVVDDVPMVLSIWLTSSDNQYDKIRPLAYSESNIIMICFAVDDPSSFENAKIKWNKEIEEFKGTCGKDSMKILIGLKTDLRTDVETLKRVKDEHNLQNLFTEMEGREMAHQIGCNGYVECSVFTGEGIDNVFRDILRLYYNRGMTLSPTELAYIQTRKQTMFTSFATKKWNKTKNCVFVGDNFSGKSALVGAIVGRKFQKSHHDNEELDVAGWKTWESGIGEETHDVSIPKFQIWDCPTGKEKFEEYSKTVREICYTFCEAVVIVFPLDEPSALERVRKKWLPEILRHVSGIILDSSIKRESTRSNYRYVRFVPIFLVGTKVDLRDEYYAKKGYSPSKERSEEEEEEVEGEDILDGKFVSKREGEEFAKEMNLYVKKQLSTPKSGDRFSHFDPFNFENSSSLSQQTSLRKSIFFQDYDHTYLECSAFTKIGVEEVVTRLNDLLFTITSSDSNSPSSPLPATAMVENKRSKVFKLREGMRKTERSIFRIISKMHEIKTQGKSSGGHLISKLRSDVEKLRSEEKRRKNEQLLRMLKKMRNEIKIAKENIMDRKKGLAMIRAPLKMKRFIRAFVGFQRLNQSRLEILKSKFVQRQKRMTHSEMTELQDLFDEKIYTDFLDDIVVFRTTSSSSKPHKMTGVLKNEGKELISVQSFLWGQEKAMYFGECYVLSDHSDDDGDGDDGSSNKKIIPNGEGYLFKGYGSSLTKKKKTYGMVFKGHFHHGVRTKKGVEIDLKTGKTLYEGQYKNGLRHGRGEEYELKKFQCRKGVWKNGKLVNEERVFEFGMISFREIENQLLPKNELGRGGNATVYDIMWKGTSRAAKIMSIPAGNNNLTYNVILRSVGNNLSLLAPLNHRHIIRLFGMIEGRRKVGYLMEKCACDVNSVITKENIPFKEKIRILFETAQGMKFLHSHEIMNRDLKWSNVLLDETRRVVLTDLDTAREDETLWRNNVQNTASSIGTQTLECPGCKCKIQTLNTYAFPTHVKNCGLRPLIDFQKQNSLREEEKWVVDLMRVCWATDPNKRPSFEEIVFILQSKLNQLEDKIIRVTVKGSSLPHQDKIILMNKTYESLREKIQSRWPNSKIRNIYLHDSKKGVPVNLKESSEEDRDFNFEKRIMEEEDPLIIVEFEEIPVNETMLSFEDLVTKLKEEREDKKTMKEQYDDVVRENIELKSLIQKMKLDYKRKLKELESQL